VNRGQLRVEWARRTEYRVPSTEYTKQIEGPARSTQRDSHAPYPVPGTRYLVLVTTLCFLAAQGCGDGRIPLTIYSPHGRDHLTLMERDFERLHPEIDVRWLDLGSQEVLDRLRLERVNPQADVWFGGPTTLFQRGVAESLLTPYRPTWAGVVDSGGIGAGDMYYPVYRTPAIIAYNNAAVPDSAAPRDWEDVLAPRWHQKVLIRDPVASGTMRAIWGMIIERGLRLTSDTAWGMAWLRRLDGQTRTYALSPALLDAKLARQEGLVTLWDLPDILISRSKGMPFGYVFPRSGTPVIDDAIALVKGSRHPEAARQFIEYAGSVEGQLLAAERVFRLPARRDLPTERIPTWVAEVEREMVVEPMDWGLLTRDGAKWMGYWDQQVRNTGRSH
jgi:iron(III) transport system substrate-binding protein